VTCFCFVGVDVTPRPRDDHREQGVGDEGANAGNVSGQGGSPSYRPGFVQSNAMIRMLQQQIADLRAHNEALQAQIDTHNFSRVPYQVCSWQHISPHMRILPKRLMLGLDPERSRIKPEEEHIKDSILEVFDVPANDRKQRKAFDRAWEANIRKKALISFNNRWGRFSTNARLEMWRLLGVPKPINARAEEMAEWRLSLIPFDRGNNLFARVSHFLRCS
jgi:hypothetical protein